MLLRRLATVLAAVLVAITFVGLLWSIATTITEPAYPVTVLIGLGFLAVFVGKGITGAISTATPYW